MSKPASAIRRARFILPCSPEFERCSEYTTELAGVPIDTPARPVRRAAGWPACGLRRLYHILLGAPELVRAKPPTPLRDGLRRAHRDPGGGGSLEVIAGVS